MPFTADQVMLTLAGLTYRGFQESPLIEGHDGRVHAAVAAGLRDLRPVKDDWALAWGPATSHQPDELLDTNAMFVVRHRREPSRYVVAIRGTNPISPSDWRLGDFWVDAGVSWPYADPAAGVRVSASTALGLAALQAMRWRPSSMGLGGALSAVAGHAADLFRAAGAAAGGVLEGPLAEVRARLRAQVVAAWQDAATGPDGLEALLLGAVAVTRPLPAILRPEPAPAPGPDAATDLLTFLASEASQAGAALDVTVTGHSKGGALAQAVALWLHEALALPRERWDARPGARVHCHGFAGPTPGNRAFAQRFEQALGAQHRHVRNMRDIVTHAWQSEELGRIPTLYGERTAPFRPLVDALIAAVGPRDYRHVQQGVAPIEGALVDSRSFPEEFIHQHLDGYLERLGLDAFGIDALRFFVG
jgi:hypothetical protein